MKLLQEVGFKYIDDRLSERQDIVKVPFARGAFSFWRELLLVINVRKKLSARIDYSSRRDTLFIEPKNGSWLQRSLL
jgi:hypothetical protein